MHRVAAFLFTCLSWASYNLEGGSDERRGGDREKDVVLEEFCMPSSSLASEGGAVEGKSEWEEVGLATVTQYDHLIIN